MDQQMLAKRTKNALERLDEHEQAIARLFGQSQMVNGQISSVGELLGAIIEILGIQEPVEKLILAKRAQAAADRNAAEKKALEDMVASKLVLVAETVSEKSILVGHEQDKEGKITNARVQVAFARVNEQFKKDLLGKAKGAQVTLPDGGAFVVEEIFDVNPTPPPPAATAPEATPPADAAPAPAAESK